MRSCMRCIYIAYAIFPNRKGDKTFGVSLVFWCEPPHGYTHCILCMVCTAWVQATEIASTLAYFPQLGLHIHRALMQRTLARHLTISTRLAISLPLYRTVSHFYPLYLVCGLRALILVWLTPHFFSSVRFHSVSDLNLSLVET